MTDDLPYEVLFPADIDIRLDPDGRLCIRGVQRIPTPAAWSCWEGASSFERQVQDWDLTITVSLMRMEHDLSDDCECRVCRSVRDLRGRYERSGAHGG